MNDIKKIIDNLKAIDEHRPYNKSREIYGLDECDKLLRFAWENTWKALAEGLGMENCNLYPIQGAFGDVRDRIVELLEETQGETRGDVVNGFKWPCFEDGTPIQKCDKFIAASGKAVPLTSISLGFGYDAVLNQKAWDAEDRLSVKWFDEEKIKRPRVDTQEKLDLDAKMTAFDYCTDILGVGFAEVDDMSAAKRQQLMVEDLLKRQREIDAQN